MPKETFREGVMSSPEINEDMWAELGILFNRYQCIRSFFGWILAEGNVEMAKLPNISTASEEGRELANQSKGVISNCQFIVGRACDEMGDKHVQESPEEEEDDKKKRSGRRPAAKKRARVKPSRSKK